MYLLILLLASRLLSSPMGTPMSETEMQSAVGGDGCFNCHAVGIRQDECYHAGSFDNCLANKCIANYCTESTCDLGAGTCTAYSSIDQAWDIQYVRQDSGCSTNNPGGMVTWFVHYYGSSCTAFTARVRCQKINNACDGTLITSAQRYPGILCQ